MIHTAQTLQNDLRRMGIAPTDTLLVHSSLRSVGGVEGRGETVIRSLMAYFAEAGLLVLPTLTYDRKAAGDPVYDVLYTPSIVGTSCRRRRITKRPMPNLLSATLRRAARAASARARGGVSLRVACGGL